MKRKIVLLPLLAILLAAIAFTAVNYVRSDTAGATKAARQFADAWSNSKLGEIAYAEDKPSPEVVAQYNAATGNLSSTPVTVTLGLVDVKRNSATAELQVDWSLGHDHWKYATKVELKKESKWAPVWNVATIQPDLNDTTTLTAVRTQPKRANILGLDGQTLVAESSIVEVGVSPQRTTDPDGLAKKLAELLGVNEPALAAQIKEAKPDAFVSVVTLRQADYESKKAELQPLPGTVFKTGTLPLAPTRQFASALLGRVGPVTAEMVKASNGRLASGDIAGVSGVQLQYDERLAGTTGVTVNLVSKTSGVAPKQLFTVAPVPGTPVQLTIDSKTQQAADTALAAQAKPSALVAMQVSSGNVLAVANGPTVGGLNNAMVGQYPPGSSFKVVTTYALLQKGVKPTDTVACPPTITVGGRSFKNAEDEAFGSAAFSTDFAHSCNTAFVTLAPKVNGTTLPDTAKVFGIGADWKLGVPAYSGSVPEPKTEVELAATAFGQGKILVSPLAMANVAASVAAGTARTPTIVSDPVQPVAAPTSLDAPTVAALQSLMRQVVTSGTGSAVAGVRGAAVHGKTGTAEFGNENPPKSHAWFIGYQGDIAFAVFVEGGEFGGETAAPMAAKFLTDLKK